MRRRLKENNKVHKCCICGTKFVGWGNNPWGAIDKDGHTIPWNKDDVCCDECDSQYVTPGRIYTYEKSLKEDKK